MANFIVGVSRVSREVYRDYDPIFAFQSPSKLANGLEAHHA
jgi:hypothetical protein